MTSATVCERSWQAEALEDGRLSALEASAFRRHAAGCRVCGASVRSLERLRELASELPEPASTALDQRRQLAELQRRAFELSVGEKSHAGPRRARSSRPGFGLAWAVSGVVVAFGALALWWSLPREDGSAARAAVPTFRIEAAAGAEWRVVEQGATLRIAALRGRIEVAVDHLAAGQRWIAELPDGELEVKGTRFTLTAEAGRTLGVEVTEGLVALRVRGEPERLLGAGERWTASDAAGAERQAAPAAPPTLAPGRSKPSLADAPAERRGAPSPARLRAETTPRGRATLGDEKDAGAPPRASAEVVPPPAGAAFVEAMAAFSAGDYERSDALFAAFARAYPGDSRVEDAVFLRAVGRVRRGDTAGAREAARVYLEQFPSGLRREEAERMRAGALPKVE